MREADDRLTQMVHEANQEWPPVKINSINYERRLELLYLVFLGLMVVWVAIPLDWGMSGQPRLVIDSIVGMFAVCCSLLSGVLPR